MNIRKIKVKNAGPFASFESDLVLGSIGVFGRNGSGKTTLMRLLHAALTRRCTMFPGVKADIVLANSKGPSYVEVVGEEQSNTFELCLSFSGRKTPTGYSRLKLKGEPEITGEPEIAARLQDMGIVPGLLDTSGFVYDVFAFLDMTESKRADFYRFLCGVEKAAVVHKVLQSVCVKPADAEYLNGQETTLLQMIGDRTEAAAAIEQKKDLLSSKLVPDARLERWAKSIRQNVAYYEAVDSVRQLTADVEADEQRGERLSQSLRRQMSAEKKFKKELEELKDAYVASRVQLSAYEKDNVRWARKEKIRAQLDKASQEKLSPPIKPDNYLSSARATEREAKLTTLLAQEVQRKERLAAGDGACPTCNQPLHDAAGLLHEADNNIESLQRQLDHIKKIKARSAAYDQKMHAYTLASEELTTRINSLRARFEDLADATQPVDPRDAAATVERVKALEVELDAASEGVADNQTALERHKAETSARKKTLAELKKRVERLKQYANVDVTKLEGRLLRQRKLKERIAVLVTRLDENGRSLSSLRRRLADVQASQAKNDKVAQLEAIYKRGESLMHWGSLPSRTISKTLSVLTRAINHSLELFDNPFTVEATDDMSFRVTFADMPSRDVTWLSKGQRVVLAVSFWSAASLFERSPGLLVLDEPTANLDAENVEYLGDALCTLRDSVRGSRQIIMTTHAHGLRDRDSFDQVIEVTR